jgi:protocadherin Fat 1/2/3
MYPEIKYYALFLMFRSSYKEVHVSLADLNDHPPVFDKEEYEIRVPESALVNTPLTRLKV